MVNNQSTFNPELHIAMLIDGDNTQHSLIELMLEEASRYGKVTIRRAYGDWSKPNLSNWQEVMLNHAIQPMQQWMYTTGKNSTDSALIIDAMDVLYSGTVQGFCIVSSDSDFTRLCTRIRESGLFVMGIGRKHTPSSLIQACDVFVYVENLVDNDTRSELDVGDDTVVTEDSSDNGAKLIELFQRAFDISVSEDGWAHLGTFGSNLKKLDSSFDSRTYGYKSLSRLIKSEPDLFEVQGEKEDGPSSIYVRMKDG